MHTPTEELFTAKELAKQLKRSYDFVHRMKARGFIMPGGTATVTEARSFLKECPKPCSRKGSGAGVF